jgi:hypothetical protein
MALAISALSAAAAAAAAPAKISSRRRRRKYQSNINLRQCRENIGISGESISNIEMVKAAIHQWREISA